MGMTTGFLEYQRRTEDARPVEERIKDYKEVYQNLPEDALREQGARCMECGIPYCHALGCPLGNLIPEWNDAVYKGQWKEAYLRLEATNNFPEITGRICPALCEASCTLSINDAPVTIRQLENTIIERAFAEGWVKPQPPKKETGKSVAVIGSGPAGLAAAQQLRRQGHVVTVFEKAAKPGGLLRYGIPNFKLEKEVIDRRLEQMEAEGVIFETNVNVGEDISAAYLQRKFDAVVITMGAGEARDLPVEGRSLPGVHLALDYLGPMNRKLGGEIKGEPGKEGYIDVKGKKVLVIGGGDTGSDCVGTANRQGASSVHQYEIMPQPREWKEPWNPNWPDWPQILRTSSSHKEGVVRDWNINTKKLEAGPDGHLAKAHFVRVEWEFPQGGGRPQMKEVAGSEFVQDVDYIFLAMGFVHVEQNKFIQDLGLEYTARGNVKVDDSYATSVEGVFAAGDANTGASLVVRALDHGRRAAAACGEWLAKK